MSMRVTLLVGLAVGWALLGTTCLPLGRQAYEGLPATSLSVSIQFPGTDTTIPDGMILTIRWTAHNATGSPGTARLYVESRNPPLTQTVLQEGVVVSGGSVTTSTAWDTSGFEPGIYVLYAEVVAGDRFASLAGSGRVTIDGFPSFEFTQPIADATFTRGGDALTIGWSGADPEGQGQVAIGLDADTDHESGNEIFIHQGTLSATDREYTIDWDGSGLSIDTVPVGTYHLFAVVYDPVNPERIFEAGVRITVQEAVVDDDDDDDDVETVTLAITKPDEDTTFLASDPALTIEFTVNQFDDVLIDLKIDTDDNHNNGNERTILSRRLVPGGTQSDTFEWDGRYADNTPVPAGIYRLFIVMDTGTGTPRTAQGKGLIFRRTYADQPLIALLEPATPRTVQAGDQVRIRWRDDDPTGQAKIRLTVDDDPRPGEGEPEGDPDDMPEMEIAADLPAEPDGELHDSYLWQVPALDTLGPGRYYIFAYIDPADGMHHLPQHSVAPGYLIIKDPLSP